MSIEARPTARMLLCRAALEAALNGDEEGMHAVLALLDQSDLSRLRNVLHALAEAAEARRKILWRNR